MVFLTESMLMAVRSTFAQHMPICIKLAFPLLDSRLLIVIVADSLRNRMAFLL